MKKKHIVNATVHSSFGGTAKGPVTTVDGKKFHFRNTYSGLDFYFFMEKKDNSWFFAGGPSSQPPQDMINEIGKQIDEALNHNT